RREDLVGGRFVSCELDRLGGVQGGQLTLEDGRPVPAANLEVALLLDHLGLNLLGGAQPQLTSKRSTPRRNDGPELTVSEETSRGGSRACRPEQVDPRGDTAPARKVAAHERRALTTRDVRLRSTTNGT